jgi:hypothetical protein
MRFVTLASLAVLGFASLTLPSSVGVAAPSSAESAPDLRTRTGTGIDRDVDEAPVAWSLRRSRFARPPHAIC